METKVLILGDLVGFGDVAMATSRAVLTKLGCTALCLPTALISNIWSMGAPAVLDTTEYLRQALSGWEARNIQPDAVLIGYLTGPEQMEFVARKCRQWHEAGVKIFLDPIFADNGKLYRGIDADRIASLRELMREADYILPNATEACFLADTENARQALPALQKLGAGGILVTGVDGNTILLWDGVQAHEISYTPVAGNFGGTGDAFTALFAGYLLAGKPAVESAKLAAGTVREWILQGQEMERECAGLPVERFF